MSDPKQFVSPNPSGPHAQWHALLSVSVSVLLFCFWFAHRSTDVDDGVGSARSAYVWGHVGLYSHTIITFSHTGDCDNRCVTYPL